MNPELPTIRMFWHGAPLSRVEKLSMASFVANGHPVELFVYEEPAGVPKGVALQEARQILPAESLFRHRRTRSLAVFADWFRYRLLFERGGIWADTDMICLRPFDYAATEIFAWQDERLVNNAVLGLAPAHPLASWLEASCRHPNRILPYDDWAARLRKIKRRLLGNGRGHVRWGESGPEALTFAARHFGYLDRALPRWHFYPVAFEDCHLMFSSPADGHELEFGDSRAVHLWNQVLNGRHGLDKNARFAPDSPFERLWERYLPER
jgi:hypothetical protein